MILRVGAKKGSGRRTVGNGGSFGGATGRSQRLGSVHIWGQALAGHLVAARCFPASRRSGRVQQLIDDDADPRLDSTSTDTSTCPSSTPSTKDAMLPFVAFRKRPSPIYETLASPRSGSVSHTARPNLAGSRKTLGERQSHAIFGGSGWKSAYWVHPSLSL
jgi:hypothetical protein